MPVCIVEMIYADFILFRGIMDDNLYTADILLFDWGKPYGS